MFGKNKNKAETSIYKECLELYKSTHKNTRENKEILNLYNQIKQDYLKIIACDNEFLLTEKIRLEKNIEKYGSPYNKNILSITTGLFSGVFILYFESSKIFDIPLKNLPTLAFNILSPIFKVIIFLILLRIIINAVDDKTLSQNKKEAIINHISLKVLDDIEKELESTNKKAIINDEVASTVQEEKQSKEQVRPISQQANGNWNVEIVVPSIVDTITSVYKVGKFARKMFRKKK